MSAALQHSAPFMTVTAFLDWCSGDRSVRGWQLIDGIPVAMAPASITHGLIQAECGRLIGNHLAATGSRCRVVTTPGVVPRIMAAGNCRVPDLGVTCTPGVHEATLVNPVLLIEILSPGNAAATRANVWSYASIPSVSDILVLHSTHIGAECLRRLPDGTWPDGPLIVPPEGELELPSIGMTVPLRDLYRTTSLLT